MRSFVKIVFIASFLIAIVCFAALSLRLPYESEESFLTGKFYFQS